MSKKQKRKFDLKSAILILLLLAALLTASTYAWFTANRVVTVSDIDVHIDTKDGLQISANGVDWKSTLTTEDLKAGYTGSKNVLPTTLEPVSTVGDVENGLMKMYYGQVDSASGDYKLYADAIDAETGNTTNGKYVAFDIFLKVNNDQSNIVLGSNSAVVYNTTVNKGKEGLQNAARVAFLKEGHSDVVDGTDVSTYLTQWGASSFSVTKSAELAATNTYIWEPNYLSHNTTASSVANSYNISTAAAVPWFGVNQALAKNNAILLKNAMKGNDDTGTASTYFTKITPSYQTEATMTDVQNAFALKAGVTKVRIYMWVEGQDVDCEDNVSGSDITFKLEFKLPESTTGD